MTLLPDDDAKREWCDELLAGLTPGELELAFQFMQGRDPDLVMSGAERMTLLRIRRKAACLRLPPGVKL